MPPPTSNLKIKEVTAARLSLAQNISVEYSMGCKLFCSLAAMVLILHCTYCLFINTLGKDFASLKRRNRWAPPHIISVLCSSTVCIWFMCRPARQWLGWSWDFRGPGQNYNPRPVNIPSSGSCVYKMSPASRLLMREWWCDFSCWNCSVGTVVGWSWPIETAAIWRWCGSPAGREQRWRQCAIAHMSLVNESGALHL